MREKDHTKVSETTGLLQAILDNTIDNIVLIGPDHRVIVCNDVIKKSLKILSGREIKPGDDYRDFVMPENKDLYDQSFEKSINGETNTVENELKSENISLWLQYKMYPVFDEAKKVFGVVLTARNIDLRKKNEIALKQSQHELAAATKQIEASEKYFRTLIETSSDAIVLIDAAGKAIYQTPSTVKISGYSLADMQHIDALDLVHPDDREDDNKAFEELVKVPGAILHKKHRLLHKNGQYIWIEGTYRNLLHDENVKAIVYNYADVTARVLSELKLKERIKELSTIYGVNSILQDEIKSIGDIFQEIVKLLPPGWQYPDVCEARIIFDGKEYATPGYFASSFRQYATLKTEDGKIGTIEVIYTRETAREDEGPFLREERDLINTLARIIEGYLNKKLHRDALAKSEANLVSILDNTNIAYLLLDRDINIVAFNSYLLNYYKELTGIVLRTGGCFIDFLLTERREVAEKILRNVLATAIPVEYEAVYNNLEPARYYTNIVNPVLANGAVIGLCITIIDITGKKYAEMERQNISEKLKENAALLQIFVEHSPAASAMFDTNMNYIQVSRRWKLDYSLEDVDLVGKNHYDIFPTLPQEWKDIHKNCLNGAIEKREEDAFVKEDGTYEWIKWEIHPWRRASGEIGGIIMLTEVITERKENELKFRNLVEKSLTGVYIIQGGKFAYVNPHIVEESGYSEEELTGMPVEKFVDGEYLAAMYRNTHARQSGEVDVVGYELRARKKDGQLLWLEIFGTSTLYKGGQAIIGTMVNVTEQKAIHDELKKSEANLRSIFDTTHVSYLLLDDQFRVLAFNQYLLKWFAEFTGTVIKAGESFIELSVPDKREGLKNALESVLANSIPVEYESVYKNKEATKYLTVTITPVINNDKTIGLCMTGHDITGRKNMEIERQKIVADLINRNRDLREFAQIVSHNLRGPLATILGLSNLLNDEATEQDKNFILEGIGTYAEKLDLVVREINNILDVKGDSSEIKASIHLDELMEEIKGKFSSLLIASKAEIEVDFSGAGEIHTLRSYIYNILYNLISNSLIFRDRNRTAVVKVWSERKNGEIILGVADNGIGIDMNRYGDQIFLLNKRFHNSADGKGLGLFIVKAQVDILNGTIEIDSTPGVGTTVRVMLPV